MSRWPLAEYRRFEKIAAAAKSLDEIVARTGRSQESILKMAQKLGVALPKAKQGRTNKTKKS